MQHTVSTISTTVRSEEDAGELARQWIDARLVACVQIDGPIRSLYRWQGAFCDEQEFRLTCKTSPAFVEAAVDFLKASHPYELPEVLVANTECSPEYAIWLNEQLVAR